MPKSKQEDIPTRRSKRKARTPEPLPEADEEKEIKEEERGDGSSVSPHQPLTESEESEEEVNTKKTIDAESERKNITTSSPTFLKEESQDSDMTESEGDEL